MLLAETEAAKADSKELQSVSKIFFIFNMLHSISFQRILATSNTFQLPSMGWMMGQNQC